MLTTLAAATLLVAAPAGDDPATLLPESTLMYFGTESVRASSKASESSAMSKIMGEAEMRAFLEKPMGAADSVLQQLLEQAKTQAAGAMPEGIDLEAAVEGDFSVKSMTEASDVPLGQMFFALTHFELANAQGVPDLGFVLGVELLEPGHLEQVREMWNGIPGEPEKGTHGGRDVFSKMIAEGLTVSMTFLDDLAVVSLSDSALKGVIDRFADDGASSLATNADYKTLLAQSNGIPTGGSATFLRVEPLVDIARMGLMIAAQEGGEDVDIMKLMSIFDELGLESQKWAGTVSHRAPDGIVHNTQVAKVDLEAPGLIPQLQANAGSLDLSRLGSVPGNTSSLTGTSISGLAAMYDFITSAAQSLAPDEYEMGMAQMNEMLGGVDLRNDLFANIEGDVWSYRLPGMGFMGASAGITTIEMNDPERFMGALDKLLDVVNTQFSEELGGEGISLKRSVHGDHDFYELDLSRTPAGAMAMGVSPAMAIKDGELWMSFESATALKTALNGEFGEESILDNQGFVAFLDDLKRGGDAPQLASVGYTDVAESFGEQYRSVAGMLGMMAGGMGDLPVDFSLLPTEQTITKHLGETYAGATLGGDDGLLVARSTSIFELGDFMPIVMTAGLLGVASELGIEPAPEAERAVPPSELAQEDISQLRAGVTVYKISVGSAPESLEDLVKPLPDYPNGCLGRPDLPLDPWGNAYNYSIKGRRWSVWSSGPNGIDENEGGDDISRKR